MKEQFKKYLIDCEYKQFTGNGAPSTVFKYLNSIEKVLAQEMMTWHELANQISEICRNYDLGGIKEKEGAISHRTVINALRKFELFLKTIK